MRAVLCVAISLAAGTCWATDWTGYGSDTVAVAYRQLNEGADVPPPPVPDPAQALDRARAPVRDEPSCAAAARPVEPTCAAPAARLAYDEPACGYAAAAPVCVQTVRVPVVRYQTVRVVQPVRVVQQVECVEQVQCATAPLAVGGGHCAARSRGRLLGGRLCARHHGGAAAGYAAATECAVAAPICGG